MDINGIIQQLSLAAIPLLFAITLHEAAHGWVASKLGDKTALMLGRVTLNPIKHIDPIGTVILPIVTMFLGGYIFGWAKPVPITTNNFKHPRRDVFLASAAGPIANLIMALIWAGVAKLMLIALATQPTGIPLITANFFKFSAEYGILINLILMILNLLPLPPLDGGKMFSCIMPRQWAYHYDKLEPFGILILLALLSFGLLSPIIHIPMRLISNVITSMFGLYAG